MIRVEGPEVVAAEAKSSRGQYLRPLLERSTTSPVRPEKDRAKPRIVSKGKRKAAASAEADQPSLIAAK